MFNLIGNYRQQVTGITRAAIGITLLSFGTQKLLHFPVAEQFPQPLSLPWIAGALELTLGFLLFIGFQSRASAFVLSGVMAFAYFIAHFPQSVFPSLNGGTAAVALCFALLHLSASGGGSFSVDGILDRRRTAETKG